MLFEVWACPEFTEGYRRLTADVQRSAVPVHSVAVPVHVHEEAIQMDQEGLDENGYEYVYDGSGVRL